MSTTDQRARKKPIYKKVWFWLLVILAIIIIATATGGGGGDGETGATPSTGGTQPAPAESAPAAAPAPDDPLSDNGWTASDIRVDANQFGTTATARITNNEGGSRSGAFTLTVFSGGAVAATFTGFANEVEGGSTASVQFVSTEDLEGVDPATFTYELQSDF